MFYIINNSNTDAYYNMACEEYLLKHKNEEMFMLWRNKSAVIIGFHQNTMSEIDAGFIEKNNIKVVRRLTGGGAVYHDLGNINFTFITNIDSTEKKSASFDKYIQIIIGILEKMGINAQFSGRNDIVIDRKKISGNSEIIIGNRLMHHGTLLFNSNLDTIVSSLNTSPYKHIDKGIKSIKSRMTNISEYLTKSMTIEEFMAEIINEVSLLNVESKNYVFDVEDKLHIQNLCVDKYSTSEWNYGASPKYNFHKATKIPGGIYQIYLTIKNNIIESVKICGDFFSLADISYIEERLVGVANNEVAVREALSGINIEEYLVNTTIDDFVSCIF